MASTLATLRDRVEATLQDSANAIWAAADIDEALRRALARYNLVNPNRAITTKTLTAAGREIDLSAVTGLLTVERVWWDYDSTDPEHPPNWRDFQLWPGSILFIDDSDEPASGDVVRIWYSLAHTLKDLDSAAATTLPTEHDSLLVIGAAGYACEMRSLEISEVLTIDGWPPQRLADSAKLWTGQFEAGLREIARHIAARQSGISQGPALDRWDADGTGWW